MQQVVHINRLGVNSIEFEIEDLEIPLSPGGEQSFEIVIINYGSPTHVHLSVGDELTGLINFMEDNPYVANEEYIPVIARIPFEGRIYSKGKVHVTVGYGAKKESFDVGLGVSGSDNMSRVSPPPPVYEDVEEKPSGRITGNGYKSGKKARSSNKKKSALSLFDVLQQRYVELSRLIDVRLLTIIIVMACALILGYLLIQFILKSEIDLKYDLGFYPAIGISILLTALIAYLLTRLPGLKK